MKFELLNQKQNPFLKRKEIELAVSYEGGPAASKASAAEWLQKEFSAPPESIEIVSIFSEHGAAKGKIKARLWEGKAPEKKTKKKAEAALQQEKK